MNLTDPDTVSLDRVFALVRNEAARHGVQVLGSELIGALRLDDLLAVARRALSMPGLHRGQVLDAWIAEGQRGVRAAASPAPEPDPSAR
jgi:glutamate formiminotransferase